jgi:hypothetical protein
LNVEVNGPLKGATHHQILSIFILHYSRFPVPYSAFKTAFQNFKPVKYYPHTPVNKPKNMLENRLFVFSKVETGGTNMIPAYQKGHNAQTHFLFIHVN